MPRQFSAKIFITAFRVLPTSAATNTRKLVGLNERLGLVYQNKPIRSDNLQSTETKLARPRRLITSLPDFTKQAEPLTLTLSRSCSDSEVWTTTRTIFHNDIAKVFFFFLVMYHAYIQSNLTVVAPCGGCSLSGLPTVPRQNGTRAPTRKKKKKKKWKQKFEDKTKVTNKLFEPFSNSYSPFKRYRWVHV